MQQQAKQSPFNLFKDRRLVVEALLFTAIVAIGIASRFWLVEMPNFKPIAALVLFGGFFFRRAWPAIAALALVMAVSDLKLGVYDWKLAVSVYVSLGLACWLGVWVKRSVSQSDNGKPPRIGYKQAGRFAIASLAMSTAFYLLTNGAVWWMGQWYPESWAGLINCYAAGLPFYRATLLGDLFFTGVLVGACCCVQVCVGRFSGLAAETTPGVGCNLPVLADC